MNPTIFRLFVYGSLRSGFHNPAYAYLAQYFNLLGEAVVKGMLYDNGSYPVARPAEIDHFITGASYELKNPEEFGWAFGQLDDYEGMNGEEGEPILYKREKTLVYQNGQPSDAWIYWYNGDTGGMTALETGDVLKYLQQKNKP